MKKAHNRKGQGLVEYALIISLIALAAVFAMSGLGQKIAVDLYGLVNGGITGAEQTITGGTSGGTTGGGGTTGDSSTGDSASTGG